MSSHVMVGSSSRTTSTSSHEMSSHTIAIAVASDRSEASVAAAAARLSCCCCRRFITPVAYRRRSRACAIWSALLALNAVTQKAEAYGAEVSHSLRGPMIEDSKPMATVPLRVGLAVSGVRVRCSLGTTAAPAQAAQNTSMRRGSMSRGRPARARCLKCNSWKLSADFPMLLAR
eukprot:scaffold25682_cov63-Phaeocystis_antarctica.AAC.1